MKTQRAWQAGGRSWPRERRGAWFGGTAAPKGAGMGPTGSPVSLKCHPMLPSPSSSRPPSTRLPATSRGANEVAPVPARWPCCCPWCQGALGTLSQPRGRSPAEPGHGAGGSGSLPSARRSHAPAPWGWILLGRGSGRGKGSICSGACSRPHPMGQRRAGSGGRIAPPQRQRRALSRVVPPRRGAGGQRAAARG